ncbi:hypothetical protein PS684_03153 [Pseudomonas fluorescens]|nr:hypothetical protein PS684_03153 [Pseudomonas fluorescens]
MKRINLKDFAKDRGQPEAASLLGMTQGALSKAIRMGRDVLVIEQGDGIFTAIEIRSFPACIARNSRLGNAPMLSKTIRLSLISEESDNPSVQISSSAEVA